MSALSLLCILNDIDRAQDRAGIQQIFAGWEGGWKNEWMMDTQAGRSTEDQLSHFAD